MAPRVGPYSTTLFLCVAAGAAMDTGCPSSAPECAAAADCGPMTAGNSSRAPPVASTYCVGGTCTARPSGSHLLIADVVTPAGVPLRSIRFAVVDPRSAVRAACDGARPCAAAAVTCQDLRDNGLDAPRWNVAQGGVRDVDTRNGTWTSFGGVVLGEVPDGQQLLAVEGRTGAQGMGDRAGWFCALFTPVESTTRVGAQLAPLSAGDRQAPGPRHHLQASPPSQGSQRAGAAPGRRAAAFSFRINHARTPVHATGQE